MGRTSEVVYIHVMKSFVNELGRRNVIRTGIAYLAVAWLILQVAEMLLPVYGFTDGAIRNLVVFLTIGLVVTLVLSWVLEWTPKGLIKESDADTTAPKPAQDHKRVDRFIIVMLVIAVAFFAIDRFVLDPARDAANIELATEKGRADALQAIANDKSVAVLPFANRSTLDEDAYFVDGIHDDILTQIARVGSLAVTSRTSVEQYRGTSLTMQEIGATLGVRAILEGGVQRSGDRVRINVQLIDAVTDEHLWAETYVRELTAANIFSVQAEIAAAVADALRVTLLPEESLALAQVPTQNIQAYDLYLLGRYHWKQRTKESIDIARGHFEDAIEKDPNYVLALSGLADSYTMLVNYGNMTGEDAHPLAQQAIDQAMAIDDSVSEVWSSLGLLRDEQRIYNEAEQAFARALELDDKNFAAWLWYADTLRRARRDAEQLAALQKAYELEPMSFVVNTQLAYVYDNIGDFSRAIQHYERADQLDDLDRGSYQSEIAWSYYWAGDYALAVDAFRNMLYDDPLSVPSLYGLTHVYLAMGELREAKDWHDQLASINAMQRQGHFLLRAQQDFDGAIAYVETTQEHGIPGAEVAALYDLFSINLAKGDIESARAHLSELLVDAGGLFEVHPRNFMPWRYLEAAAFWMAHGDDTTSEPQQGRALAEEVRSVLVAMTELGWHRPSLLSSLAATEGLLGNTPAAIARLNEAIDNGYKNQMLSLSNTAFDTIRDTREFALARERMEDLIEDEEDRLDDMDLAPYTPPGKREPVPVAADILRQYEGWYTNGSITSHVRVGERGGLMLTYGRNPEGPLLAVSNDQFYSPYATDFTMQFFLEENGPATHMLFKSPDTLVRMKRIAAPPPAVQLPSAILDRYVGTFAYDRLGDLEGERTESDYWVADFVVDNDGKIWIDYDNQSKIEMFAFSDTEFQMIGFLAQLRFVRDPATEEYNAYTRTVDGAETHFYRR